MLVYFLKQKQFLKNNLITMREIKFRLWNKKESIMVRECFSLYYNGKVEFYDTTVSDDRIILLQYTGIKDKNDVKVFEGDIVTYHYFKEWNENSYSDVDITHFGEVFFNKGSYQIHETEEYSPHLTNTCIDSIEVIGNIYENKELITTQ